MITSFFYTTIDMDDVKCHLYVEWEAANDTEITSIDALLPIKHIYNDEYVDLPFINRLTKEEMERIERLVDADFEQALSERRLI